MRPRFIGFEVEEEVYEVLRRLAYERRTSLSSVARELLMMALEQLNLVKRGQPQQAQQAVDPPSRVDPVAKLDIEDMSEELDSVEAALSAVERELSKLPQNPTPSQVEFFIKFSYQRLLDKLVSAENRLKKLRYRYYKVKRGARNKDLERVAERIYSLNKKLKSLSKRLEELKRAAKR
jgi:predicted RNase H-like nuclease (RuvC/YqgF family)